MIKVFSTSRGVREFYANYKGKSTILPKAITIAEFESKAIFVKNRTFIDKDNRLLLLREAINFKEYNKLQFSSEFMIFLSHSKYIFKFFDELSSEEIEISTLKEFDMYALYDEHLEALEILRQRYVTLLDKNGFVDRLNIGSLYETNEDYLKSLGGIEFELDGFLSSFEINLFAKCSKTVPFYINLELNTYNQKNITTFKKLGFDLKKDNAYRLNLSEKTISTCRAVSKAKIDVKVEFFGVRLSQIGFIFSHIQCFVEEGLEPKDIAVVLPDESMAEFLKEFDNFKNLNFAMGISLQNSMLYKRLEAIELYISNAKEEQKLRLSRLNMPEDLSKKIQKNWKRKQSFDEVIEILNDILILDENEKDMDIINEEIFRFSKFLCKLENLTLEQSFRLFLKRLKERSEDDIRGGKITVMGVLETRGANFKGVIVPDFSDDFVPRRSGKDLFLNTQIRKNIGLPTREDRENLQKYYYHRLFKNAKKLAISAVSNETTMPSRFIDELGLSYKEGIQDDIYNTLLFRGSKIHTQKPKEVRKLSYRLDSQPLSATKLNTLLSCKRKFYFRYIEKIEEPRNSLESSNAQVGLRLHKAMERVFGADISSRSKEEIYTLLRKELVGGYMDELEEFELESWMVRLKDMVANEKRRFDEGYRVYANELSLNSDFEGFKITGKIDRIDKKGDKLYVIDYKSGDTQKLLKQKIENMTNFQLEFYYLLVEDIGKVEGVYYYDLKEAELKSEYNLKEKIEKLKAVLKSFKEPIDSFEMCEKHNTCLYCPYKKLCLRES